ncbi:MAG: hypothetical protein AAF909_14400, partial [Pseudomonadota bacterium]
MPPVWPAMASPTTAAMFLSASILTTPLAVAQPAATDGGERPRTAIPWLQDALQKRPAGRSPIDASPPVAGAPTATPQRSEPQRSAPESPETRGLQTPAERGDAPPTPRSQADLAAGSTQPGLLETVAPTGAANPAFDRDAAAASFSPAAHARGSAAAPAPIEIAPLGQLDRSGVGELTAADAGAPSDGWSGVRPEAALTALAALKPGPYRRPNSRMIDLLRAALAGPRGGDGGAYFRARIDALSRFGAAAAAARVAALAGPTLAPSGAKAALISGAEAVYCPALLGAPSGDTARIYCQAVSGDPTGARLAMEAARALNAADEPAFAIIDAVIGGRASGAESADFSGEEAGQRAALGLRTALTLAALRQAGAPPPANFSRDAPLTLLPADRRIESG